MVCAPNKRLKQRGLRPLDSQQVARRLGDSYVAKGGAYIESS